MSAPVLTAVAWPYANGPRHIGHVSGIGVPSDVFSRYMRMSGRDVLMVSGSDEHGTPILVQADNEGLTPQQTADRYHRVIAGDMRDLGVTYDLYTHTTSGNHAEVTQQIFLALHRNGYIIPKTTKGAISPSTGRTLPDRYVEGTCPICGYDGARGDQCDNCGNQLDAADLINPRSRINGEKPQFVETEHLFLDLPAFTQSLGKWLGTHNDWRPNVLNFTRNLVEDMRPRPITRDLDWGVRVPLDGWRDQSMKRFYVWFDAVIGYFSASVEWARRSGNPDAWQKWWNDPDAQQVYFMGKDNITFHAQIWPALLLGHNGQGDKGGTPGPYGQLNLPTEIASSEFLTMSGSKFSTSRGTVIYLGDFLKEFGPDSLRYFISAAGPETQDVDFTWEEFVRRINFELNNEWGNLVNRSISMAHKNVGAIPRPTAPTAADEELKALSRNAFTTVGEHLKRSRFRAGAAEAMRVAQAANKYLSDQEPWKRKDDPERRDTILHTALQVVSDVNTLFTPFLPHSAQKIHEALGGTGIWAAQPELREVTDLDIPGREYPVITGDYAAEQARWESIPIEVGRPLEKPTPLFTKLDPKLAETGPEFAPIEPAGE
jgi:methionyl-tRNA synthetase